ncbi:MAG: hypothetical protein VYC34_02105, partial [Planctomycetota bacterium]|nr:hypothetical protein [Planctomycetota bacterium]
LTVGAILDQLGAPSEDHIRHAHDLLRAVPEPLREAAAEPFTARAVIHALLLNDDPTARRAQLNRLAEFADPGLDRETQRLVDPVRRLDARARLTLIDLAIPSLASMSPPQYQRFRANVEELVKADDRLALFEWILQRIVIRHLDAQFHESPPTRVKYYGLQRLAEPTAVLLSTLAYTGNRDPAAAQSAFTTAAAELDDDVAISLLPINELRFDRLSDALDALEQTAPKVRGKVVRAAAACVIADHEVTVEEAELLRAICDSLDCPMPPLLPGQRLALK